MQEVLVRVRKSQENLSPKQKLYARTRNIRLTKSRLNEYCLENAKSIPDVVAQINDAIGIYEWVNEKRIYISINEK